MPIRKIERYRGGTRNDVLKAATVSKAKNLGYGASAYTVGQIHTGAATGEWFAEITYPDWETYGKVTTAMAGDAAWQAVLAELARTTTMQDRVLVVDLDL